MTDVDLMTFQDQLEAYPAIKEMLTTKPAEPVRHVNVAKPNRKPVWVAVPLTHTTPPWRVYARRTDSSNWARKDFPTYKGAFDFFKLKRKVWHDVSITSKRQAFLPPGRTVRLKRAGQPLMVKGGDGKLVQATRIVPVKPPPGHLWCMYCRRFTVFTWFRTHHAHRGEQALLMDPSARRCCVCGIREETGAFQ